MIDEQSGSVHLQAVTTGQITSYGIQVVDGLQAGEWIAVAGVRTLSEGQKVHLDTTEQ